MNKSLKIFPLINKYNSMPIFFVTKKLNESDKKDLIKLYELYFMQEELMINGKIKELLKNKKL